MSNRPYPPIASLIRPGMQLTSNPDEDDEDPEAAGPQEGDYTTSDHRAWFQDGKLVLTVRGDADHVAALEAHMAKNQFWPNAWFVSDHGNAHLIDLAGVRCAGCGEEWPCSDSKRRDISGRERAKHHIAPRGNASGNWEVVGPDGSSEVFAREEDADFAAAEYQRAGLRVQKQRRQRPAPGQRSNPKRKSGLDPARDEALADLQLKKARYLRALGYAGNTPDQVRTYHEAIDELDASMRLLKQRSNPRPRTFDQARRTIIEALANAQWKMSPGSLKIPHATSPDGQIRLWFKPQAVWFTEGNRHDFKDARSLWFDIREYGSGEAFLEALMDRVTRHRGVS